MSERMMQVPVSLIEELGAADDTNEGERFYAALRRLRALLSQPTPTAEPVLPARAVAAVMDTYDNGDGECEPEDRWRLFRDMRSLLASEQVVVPAPAEPPRIEDMAPGTTFSAYTIATRYSSRWTVLPSGRVESGMGIGHEASEIDLSTIRDVTPPAVNE